MVALTARPIRVLGSTQVSFPVAWHTIVGYAATAAGFGQALSDNSDATWIGPTIAGPDNILEIQMDPASIPTLPSADKNPVWLSAVARIRLKEPTGTTQVNVTMRYKKPDGTWMTSNNVRVAPTNSIQTFTVPIWTDLAGQPCYTVIGGVQTPLIPEILVWQAAGGAQNLLAYEAYIDLVANEAPIAIPNVTGNTVGSTPVVSWDVSDAENDPQYSFIVKVFSQAQYTAAGFNPAQSLPIASFNNGAEVMDPSTNSVTVSPVPVGTNYRAYVGLRDQYHGAGSQRWAFAAFDIGVVLGATPVITGAADNTNNRAVLTFQGFDNMLATDDADLEASIGTWLAGSNVVVSQSADFAFAGTKSLKMSAVGAGASMAAVSAFPTGIPVVAGQSYWFSHEARAAASPRTVAIGVAWYDSTNTQIGGLGVSPGAPDVVGGWTQDTVTATAPAGAVVCLFYDIVLSPGAANELHYFDQHVIKPAGSTVWTRGGLVPSQAVTFERSDDAQATWKPVYALTGLDEPNGTQFGTHYDLSQPVGATSYYRAYSISYDTSTGQPVAIKSAYSNIVGPITVTAPVAPPSSPTGAGFWLIDLSDATPTGKLRISIRGDWETDRDEIQALFRPLGRHKPVVLGDGVQGEVVTLPLNFFDAASYNQFETLRARAKVLLIQTDFGQQLYVRLGATRKTIMPASTARLGPKPYRSVDTTATEVDLVTA